MNEEIIKKDIIKTINFNQQDLINDIIKLHVPSGQIDCDPCFSKGVFYKNGKVKIPIFRYDIEPQLLSVEKCDCRNLPLKDNSINSVSVFLWTTSIKVFFSVT